MNLIGNNENLINTLSLPSVKSNNNIHKINNTHKINNLNNMVKFKKMSIDIYDDENDDMYSLNGFSIETYNNLYINDEEFGEYLVMQEEDTRLNELTTKILISDNYIITELESKLELRLRLTKQYNEYLITINAQFTTRNCSCCGENPKCSSRRSRYYCRGSIYYEENNIESLICTLNNNLVNKNFVNSSWISKIIYNSLLNKINSNSNLYYYYNKNYYDFYNELFNFLKNSDIFNFLEIMEYLKLDDDVLLYLLTFL